MPNVTRHDAEALAARRFCREFRTNTLIETLGTSEARANIKAPIAWADYLHWQAEDAKLLARVNLLLKECAGDPFCGTGKPEPLGRTISGWWSRRIDREHRLVYRVTGSGGGADAGSGAVSVSLLSQECTLCYAAPAV